MIKKNARPEGIADILNNLDDADVLICAAMHTKGLTKVGDTVCHDALHTLRRFIEMLEEEATEKFGALKWSGDEWL